MQLRYSVAVAVAAAGAPIRHLDLELPYATSRTIKRKGKKKSDTCKAYYLSMMVIKCQQSRLYQLLRILILHLFFNNSYRLF